MNGGKILGFGGAAARVVHGDGQIGGGDQVGADGGVEGRERELDAVAGADQFVLGLGELDLEIEHIGFDGAAGLEPFPGHAQTFREGLHGFLLHSHIGGGLEDAVVAGGDLVDELVLQALQNKAGEIRAAARHLGVESAAAEIEERVLNAEAEREIVRVGRVVEVGLQGDGPLVEQHHEGLRGIVGAGNGRGSAEHGVVGGLGFADGGARGLRAFGGGAHVGIIGE